MAVTTVTGRHNIWSTQHMCHVRDQSHHLPTSVAAVYSGTRLVAAVVQR